MSPTLNNVNVFEPKFRCFLFTLFQGAMFLVTLLCFHFQKLTKIKIYSSVLLENIPQIIFQALYSAEAGVTTTVLFAALASILSVLAAGLSYFIDRDDVQIDVEAIEYFFALECTRVGMKPRLSRIKAMKDVEDRDQFEVCDSLGDLTEAERDKVKRYSGFRKTLSRSLARMWHIPYKSIQVGATQIAKTGAHIHIVQLMKREDLDICASMLFQMETSNEVPPLFVVRKFYELKSEELTRLFRVHFHLGSDFDVEFEDYNERRERSLSSRLSVCHDATSK